MTAAIGENSPTPMRTTYAPRPGVSRRVRDGQVENQQGYGDSKNPVAERLQARRAPRTRTI